ncbi:MAG: SAM-dependent methyltransferase [Proteobacteria bacterium]|nr:SAM-dependent methyltransferase [Pseudomonadota bacterium]
MNKEVKEYIKRIIKLDGYVPIDIAMRLSNDYYYNHQNTIGRDFITAPEISSLFGASIGSWIKKICNGILDNIILIELGAGSGVMMRDILQNLSHGNFIKSVSNILICESSSSLQSMQKKILRGYDIQWIKNQEELLSFSASGYYVIIANEFFDALPIKQVARKNNQCLEIALNMNSNEEIFSCFVPANIAFQVNNTEGIMEISLESLRWINTICSILNSKNMGGHALIIDYGYTQSPLNSTLQAMRLHKAVNWLDGIGDSDITALVNFKSLMDVAEHYNMKATLTSQKDFLIESGIMELSTELKNFCNKDKISSNIDWQVNKLTDISGMGNFKVLKISAH